MINRLLTLSCVLLFYFVDAQKEVLDKYPYGQDFYAGGKNEFNKEMVRIVKEQKLKPCEKSEEQYNVQILVNEDSSINYVKDFDSMEINNNKCAFDFSRKIIPHLKRWMPAKEDGKYISAITVIQIKPFYLYYSKEDPKKNETQKPTYKKGMGSFLNEVKAIFEDKVIKNEDRGGILTFVVNENGGMEDFKISGDFSESDKKDIINKLSRMKGKWNPATFNSVPFRTKIAQVISQHFDIQLEHEERMRSMNQTMNNNRYR